MKRTMLGRCWVLLSVVLLSGCRSDEDTCETLCQWLDECAGLDADCTESEIEDCAEDVDDLSDSCEDGLGEFVDCLDENDNDCDEINEHCRGEASEFVEQCDGEL